ncbi:MAG: leucine-rich repeat protein [Kiritimatiellae bacterium]|nr:leucine-rich repeat protein [Kiritimatiellia bacterium]
MKTKFLLVFAALASFGLSAETWTDDKGVEWTFQVIKEKVELISVAMPAAASGTLAIPATFAGYPLASINSGAFKDIAGLRRVTIPDGVSSIGDEAFSGCTGLKSATIPASAVKLGASVFKGCSGLKSVTLPDSVTAIGDSVFSGCSGLESITLSDNVTGLGDNAFSGCVSLKRVTIPDSVTSIGAGAFSGCNSLTSLVLPASVVSIGSSTFSFCLELVELKIPAALTSIGAGSFVGCEKLATIYVDEGDTERVKTLMHASGLTDIELNAMTFKEMIYRLTVRSSNASGGSASGGGLFGEGMAATLMARAKKGYAFAGWFTNKACTRKLNPEGCDNREPLVEYEMPEKTLVVYAKFVTKADDKKALKFDSKTKKLAKTAAKATAGAEFALALGISSASLPTITASGLPKGLKIDAATGEISGTPAKPGSYTATVTVTSAAGNKISQKVKFTVRTPGWMRGTFDGVAYPGGDKDPPGYLTFTVSSAGKISGKVTYKGTAYKFTSAYKAASAKEATFAPSVKIGKKTFKPGAVTVYRSSLSGLNRVIAADDEDVFLAQKEVPLVCRGAPLAGLVGKTYTFTKATEDSGLTKSKDKLKIKFADGDVVQISGTVKGKKVSAFTAPLTGVGKSEDGGLTTYELRLDVIVPAAGYYRMILFGYMIDAGGGVVAEEVEFD